MALGGINPNIAFHSQRPTKRPGQPASAPRPEDQAPGQQPEQSQNATDGQSRRGIAQYQQHLPNAEQYQQFKDKSANDDSFSRYLGMSLGTARAINTYHQMETQPKRDEITQMLGLDIYV